MTEVDVERFKVLWADFLGGVPIEVMQARIFLLVVFLLGEIQAEARDAIRLVDCWMADFERRERVRGHGDATFKS